MTETESTAILDAIRDLKQEFEAFIKEWRGSGNDIGMRAKIQIMWRGHVWLLCTLSAGVGIPIGMFIQKAFGIMK